MYGCKILKDSVNPLGHRLTTFEIRFPRMILAELNTHRMLSRNSASSRAIPTEAFIQACLDDPFVPEFNARVKGMGVGESLEGTEAGNNARRSWLSARDHAVNAATAMLDVDKSRANRLLEPFLWHTAIVTATEWDNFYALRDHEAAQPEFRTIARMMREAHDASVPVMLDYGQWHLPLVFPGDCGNPDYGAAVSAGRCARVSYDKQHAEDGPEAAVARWEKLSSMGHWSPGEHPARSMTRAEWDTVLCRQDEEAADAARKGREPNLDPFEFCGNFRGWVQLRKHYEGEAVFQG